MRRVTPLPIAAWLVATAVATVVSWVGVGAVTRAIAPPSDPVIPAPHASGVAASSPAARQAITTWTVPTTSMGSPTQPSDPTTRTSTSDIRGHAASATTTTTLPAAGPSPAVVSTTTTTAPATSTVAPPPGQTTTTTTRPGASVTPGSGATAFSNVGGLITVTCQGSAIALQSAVPADGFQVTVQSSGPLVALVRFTSSNAIYPLGAQCQNGTAIRIQPSATSNSTAGPSATTAPVP